MRVSCLSRDCNVDIPQESFVHLFRVMPVCHRRSFWEHIPCCICYMFESRSYFISKAFPLDLQKKLIECVYKSSRTLNYPQAYNLRSVCMRNAKEVRYNWLEWIGNFVTLTRSAICMCDCACFSVKDTAILLRIDLVKWLRNRNFKKQACLERYSGKGFRALFESTTKVRLWSHASFRNRNIKETDWSFSSTETSCVFDSNIFPKVTRASLSDMIFCDTYSHIYTWSSYLIGELCIARMIQTHRIV